jgi:hypothetical protein
MRKTSRNLFVTSFALSLAAALGARAGGDVPIDDKYPIERGGVVALSLPHVRQTNECATHVYVESIVPGATIRVFLTDASHPTPSPIGGPVARQQGYFAVPLTQALKPNDSVTATQTVNGIPSGSSAPMIVGAMPADLPAPTVDAPLYACGRIAPVSGIVSGADVDVIDKTIVTATNNGVIGSGFTPNDWGDDFAPVVTSSLVQNHQIVARQRSCAAKPSGESGAQSVSGDVHPLPAPTLDQWIPGNDSVTAQNLYVGALVDVFAHANGVDNIASGYATGSSNVVPVSPDLQSTFQPAAQQSLCTDKSGFSPPQGPGKLQTPILVGPICPGQTFVTVRGTTPNGGILALMDSARALPIGYGGAEPGDATLDVAGGVAIKAGDTITVVEYIGSDVVTSNAVRVGCQDVLTYHNDTLRTGWNPAETILKVSNVTLSSFGFIGGTTLDDQVDAQPLIVSNQVINGANYASVAYVATESNTVYAIDGSSGAIITHNNLGKPVPTPLNCNNNGPNVGIDSTPTIDRATQTLYVISYNELTNGAPAYELHALDLATLQDRAGSPSILTATNGPTAKLVGGTTVQFDPSVQRQRPGLLLANGAIYAGFGSYCDFDTGRSRGWVVGWKASDLTLLPGAEITDKDTPAQSNFLLSSVWMSGFGLAAEATGDLYFTTGNTSTSTFDPTNNLSESIVRLRSDLSGVADHFTAPNESVLDDNDIDFASGGVMLLPDQKAPTPHLAVAAGKYGQLFIVNRDNMSGTNGAQSNVVVGPCWCGPSYYLGPKGPRVVTSGGGNNQDASVGPSDGPTIMQWKVDTAQTPALTLEASAAALENSPHDGGLFTSISSDNELENTAIIWAVNRANGKGDVELAAFNATALTGSLKQIWSSPAGTWGATQANPNIVPTVANGRVYVASDQELRVFGLYQTAFGAPTILPLPLHLLGGAKIVRARAFPPATELTFWGTIEKVDGHIVTLDLRSGKTLAVDITKVAPLATSDAGAVGRRIAVNGTKNSDGVLVADGLWRVKAPQSWGPDSEN